MLYSAISYDSTHIFGSNYLHQNKGIHWFFMAISVPFHCLCAKNLWSQLVLQFPHGWTTKTQHHQSIRLIKGEEICLYVLRIRMVHFGVSPNQNGSSWVVFLHLVEQFCVYSTGIPRVLQERCMRTTTIYRMYYFYIVHTNIRH